MFIMESQQMNIETFSEIPSSFLTEVTEDDFLKDIQSNAKDAESTEPEPEKVHIKLSDIESHETGNENFGIDTGLNAANFLSEDIAVELYDTILVGIASTILSFAEIEMKKSELSFSAKEKNTLKPIIKQCLEQTQIKFTNPFEALFWTSGIILATKIFSEKGNEIVSKLTGKKEKKTTVQKDEKKPISKYMQKKREQQKKDNEQK